MIKKLQISPHERQLAFAVAIRNLRATGFHNVAAVVDWVGQDHDLAHRWAPVIEAVGELVPLLLDSAGCCIVCGVSVETHRMHAPSCEGRALSAAYNAMQPPDPDTEQVDGEMPQYTGLCECSPDTSHEKGVCMVCGFPRMHLHDTEQHGLPTDVNEDDGRKER